MWPPVRGRYQQGQHSGRITDNYNGDFNTLKNNLNTCIDAVGALVADAVMLSKAAVEGKLATRADASKHQAIFARSCRASMTAWTRSSSPCRKRSGAQENSRRRLNRAGSREYQGDHAEIKNNINAMTDGCGPACSRLRRMPSR